MHRSDHRPFAHVPLTAGGHFVLYLYAAIFRLINHVRRLSETGGPELEQMFERYPFLAEYFTEMRRHMPEEIEWEASTMWWQHEIGAWEAACEEHLPLRSLARESGIDFASRLAFMATGLVEEDSRFGTLFAELQQPVDARRPTLELLGQMMTDQPLAGESDPWTICRPLLATGLVQAPDRQVPRSEWLLRVPPLLWDAARGQVDPYPAPGCRYYSLRSLPALAALIIPPELLHQSERVPALVHMGKIRTVILRSPRGADSEELMGALARTLGRGLLVADSTALESEVAQLLAPLCALSGAMPLLNYELGPGETATAPELHGYAGPVGCMLGLEGGLNSRSTDRSITLSLPPPPAQLRQRHWRQALNGHEIVDLQSITDNFHLAGGYIRRVAKIAVAQAGLDGRDRVCLADVREASRTLNRQLLDTLANPLEAHGSRGDLITAAATTAKLRELACRCRYRERLLAYLGTAFSGNANPGVRALFTGPSGTGKTLAARVLAAELGMDLYRVDLAAVVNKYIGETEKNLHQVLSHAEALDVVLLLDEGDALLGHRTQVKSANDRYANLETNYLLQRLENYRGIALVTTNLGENIDTAFQRRMDVVVPFFPPQAEERWGIMLLHLPTNHDVDGAYLERVATRCALNGGQIRSAALHATLLALDAGGGAVQRCHLEQALRSEYRKAGGVFPLENAADTLDYDDGMESFSSALDRS